MDEPTLPRICAWCRLELRTTARSDAKFCSRRCRQTAFRIRRRHEPSQLPGETAPLRFAYADPPYPGLAARYYRDQPDFAGEVDHASLLQQLQMYDGWALSTSARALRAILPLCPPNARVCAWVKPHGVSTRTYGLHNAWEPVVVVPGRHLRPGRPDFISAYPARGGGTLPGRKPETFCVWLFGLLGILPGDSLDDMYPGTGIVERSWEQICRYSSSDGSTAGVSDASSRHSQTRR